VNELLARLTDKPVEDHTTTDPDLDKNPDSFPIGSDAPRVVCEFEILSLKLGVVIDPPHSVCRFLE
jgi:hypothetical protein